MFGTVTYRSGHGRDTWIVHCEPQVRSRLKRVFPRVAQGASDIVELSVTPENSRELRWFLERYPMDVEQRDKLERLAAEHINTEQRIAELAAARRPPLDVQLALPPRDYQLSAAALLDVKTGLLVADDVGLGKTVTAICSLVDPENLPALVVCPTHLPRQWANSVAQFAPALSTHIVTKGIPYPIKRAERAGEQLKLVDRIPDVVITNYHKLRGWADTLAGIARLVVFDECQQLRRDNSEIYRAAELVATKARRRVGLSATPIYNYGAEFFNVIDVLLPGSLGEYHEFLREWCSGGFGEKARITNTHEFGTYLRREGIMVRRTRRDVGRELPPLQKIIHTVDVDPTKLDHLKGDAIRLAEVVLQHNEQFKGQKMQAAGEFDAMMRQATGVAKAPFVAEFVRLLLESERRVILFGWHHEVYGIWRERLHEFNPVAYTGQESPGQKEYAIESFKSGKSRVLLMSLRSGAGVDGLQGFCRTVVFGELDWSPGVHEQCVGRLHRDGQGEPTVAYFLNAEEGCDPVMIDVLGIKREQIEGVRNPERPLVERVDLGENSIQRLAREFLIKRGVRPPEEAAVA